jgi:hypothetical protein
VLLLALRGKCQSDTGWVPYDASIAAHIESERSLNKLTTTMQVRTVHFCLDDHYLP